MSFDDRILTALGGPEPARALTSLVFEMSREGQPKQQIIEMLQAFVLTWRGRADYTVSGEDVVFEVLDGLTGWCHPNTQLLPDGESSRR
jgi:hypothetical protein